MNYLLLILDWNSSIPKNVLIFLLGITLLIIGIIWLIVNEKKKWKKSSMKWESNFDFWRRMEFEIDIWAIILAGLVATIYGFVL